MHLLAGRDEVLVIDWFDAALRTHKRIAVTGGHGTGKTTLCERVHDRQVIHTDDFMHLEWSACSEKVRDVVNALSGPIVVEGVRVPHALRKGMLVDCVIWLDSPYKFWGKGHTAQKDGMWKVLGEWRQSHPRIPVIIPAPTDTRRAMPVQVYPPTGAKHD